MIKFLCSIKKISMDAEGAYTVQLDVPESEIASMVGLQGEKQKILVCEIAEATDKINPKT